MTHDEVITAVCADLPTADGSPDQLIDAARRSARRLLPLAADSAVEAVAQAAVAHVQGLGPLQIFLG